MARNKRDKLQGSGMQFDNNAASGGQPSIQEYDNAAFGGDANNATPPEDDLLASLPKTGFKPALKASGGVIHYNGFVMTMTGLEYNGEGLRLEEWVKMGTWLTQLRDAIQWMIGDWANLGEKYMHEWMTPAERTKYVSAADSDSGIPDGKYKWLAEKVDYKYGTLRNFAYIASLFPVSRRRDTLTYSHHVEVASLESVSVQERMLDRAETEKLSIRALRDLVQREQGILLETGETPNNSPLYTSVMRIQQELTPDRWGQMSADERRQIHANLRAVLLKIEDELGID